MLRGSWESRSRSTRLEPMKPAEPVMRMVLLFCDINIFAFFLATPPAADAFADAFVFAVEGDEAAFIRLLLSFHHNALF